MSPRRMTNAPGSGRRDQRRHAVVLVGVLVVVVVLALIGATALVFADAQLSAAQGSLRREQSRATAWSGVQAAMAELAAQREALLDGQTPQLTAQWTLFGEATGPAGIVRLLEIEPGVHQAAEAGKLDLNTATRDMLLAAGSLDAAEVDAVIAARRAAPYASVEDVFAAAHIGTPAESPGRTDAHRVPSSARAEAGGADETTATNENLFTVFAFEPNTQLGLGPDGEGFRGKPRLYVATAWNDAFRPVLGERFDDRTAAAVERVWRDGAPQSRGDLVAGLRRRNVPVKDWAEVLDALTVSHDEYLAGMVDVLTAPAAVLRAVPGITPDAAEQILRLRDRIDSEARRSVTWMVEQNVLTPDAFQQAVDYVTCQSLQRRVRVEAGMRSSGQDPARSAQDSQALRDRVVLEAVIDLSGPTPRLAYLRDVTMLDVTVPGPRGDEDDQPAHPLAELVGPADAAEPGPLLELDGSLNLNSKLEMRSRLNLRADMKGADLDLDSDLAAVDRDDEQPGESTSDGLTERPEGGQGVDRRVGRWKIPRKSM